MFVVFYVFRDKSSMCVGTQDVLGSQGEHVCYLQEACLLSPRSMLIVYF